MNNIVGAAVSSVEIYSGIIDYIDIGSRIELNCSAVGDDVYYESMNGNCKMVRPCQAMPL